MSKQTIRVNNGGFWSFAKWLVILIIVVLGLSLIGDVIYGFKSFFAPEKIDAKAAFMESFDKQVKNGTITLVTDPQKEIIKTNMDSESAIAIDDIITNMTVYDYNDIVVFVKNKDSNPYNVVFRKTDNGLVLDGMMIKYYWDWGRVKFGNFYPESTAYGKYNYHDFQSKYILNVVLSSNSCFSFNDAVSKAVLFNANVIPLIPPFQGIATLFASYNTAFIKVSDAVTQAIFREFTSFDSKQHIMFDSEDEFSAFYSDVYQSIASLQKDCLVDYTNSEYVGLYDGVPGTETCKYYKGNSKFVVEYNKLNTRAYSVDSGDYADGHTFDTEYSVIAYPKITFNLSENTEKTNMTAEEIDSSLKNNPLNIQAVLTNLETNETQTFKYDKTKNQAYAYLDYVEYKIDLSSTNDIVKFDLDSFTFTVDTVVSKVDMTYYYSQELVEGDQKNFYISFSDNRTDELNWEPEYQDMLGYITITGTNGTDREKVPFFSRTYINCDLESDTYTIVIETASNGQINFNGETSIETMTCTIEHDSEVGFTGLIEISTIETETTGSANLTCTSTISSSELSWSGTEGVLCLGRLTNGTNCTIDFVFCEDKTSVKIKNLELGTYTLTLTTATNGQITYGENTGVGSLTITIELTEENPTIEGEILISKKS